MLWVSYFSFSRSQNKIINSRPLHISQKDWTGDLLPEVRLSDTPISTFKLLNMMLPSVFFLCSFKSNLWAYERQMPRVKKLTCLFHRMHKLQEPWTFLICQQNTCPQLPDGYLWNKNKSHTCNIETNSSTMKQNSSKIHIWAYSCKQEKQRCKRNSIKIMKSLCQIVYPVCYNNKVAQVG